MIIDVKDIARTERLPAKELATGDYFKLKEHGNWLQCRGVCVMQGQEGYLRIYHSDNKILPIAKGTEIWIGRPIEQTIQQRCDAAREGYYADACNLIGLALDSDELARLQGIRATPAEIRISLFARANRDQRDAYYWLFRGS